MFIIASPNFFVFYEKHIDTQHMYIIIYLFCIPKIMFIPKSISLQASL